MRTKPDNIIPVQARLIVFLFLIQMGCAPMAETHLQVMDPAEVSLPENVQKLAFLNRSRDPSLLLPGDTFRVSKEDLLLIDTIMKNWIFVALSNSMLESPLYDLDTVKLLHAWRFDTISRLKPLLPEQLQRIREIQDADALLSLEDYNVRDSLHLIIKYVQLTRYFEAYRTLHTSSLWRIYDLRDYAVIDEYTLADTVERFFYAQKRTRAVENTPNLTRMALMAASRIGDRYAERISPKWITSPRFYYISGGKGMRKASRKAIENDWTGAAEIWKKIAYQEKRKPAFKAAYNMALVCEMEDLLSPAVDWATKSYSIYQKPLTKDYIELLNKRIEEREKLEKQLPEI